METMTVTKKKRKYEKRTGEWEGMDPLEIYRYIVEEINPLLKRVQQGIKTLQKEAKEVPAEMEESRKDLTNRRVRAYARIRKLGGNVKELKQFYKCNLG